MKSEKSNLKRMDNVSIAVESLDETIAFFAELGLKLEGRAMVEGEWAGRVTGLGPQRVEIAMMVTPDGHSRLEISRFLTPPVVADHRNAPVNALGYLRVMFTVDDLDETLARLRKHGAQVGTECGAGVNEQRPRYLTLLAHTSSSHTVVENKDRCTRLGVAYIQTLLNAQGRESVIVSEVDQGQGQEALLQDLGAIISSFSA